MPSPRLAAEMVSDCHTTFLHWYRCSEGRTSKTECSHLEQAIRSSALSVAGTSFWIQCGETDAAAKQNKIFKVLRLFCPQTKKVAATLIIEGKMK